MHSQTSEFFQQPKHQEKVEDNAAEAVAAFSQPKAPRTDPLRLRGALQQTKSALATSASNPGATLDSPRWCRPPKADSSPVKQPCLILLANAAATSSSNLPSPSLFH